MGLIRRTAASRADYQQIWEYVAEQGSISAADRLLHVFDEQLELLSEFPGAGRARPELRVSIRSFVVGDYLLFYRPVSSGIELIRVLHGARDIRQVLRRGGA
jgi:toxin ParE1/3/4